MALKTMTTEMRAEIKEYRGATNEGLLSEEDFRDAVAIICSTGWEDCDDMTKAYFQNRLQGMDVETAAHKAAEENKHCW